MFKGTIFFRDFEALKSDNKDNENKIVDLQRKIDDFTKKADITEYQRRVNTIFVNHSKLLPDSLRYLSTGQYLLHNIEDHSDFSPVILQYGRSIENELKGLFINIHPTKKWTIGMMQGSLEKYKFGTPTVQGCTVAQYLLLQSQLPTIFNTPTDLKVELIEDLRVKRNEAAHPGPVRTKAEALAYINKTEDFIKKWIELKK